MDFSPDTIRLILQGLIILLLSIAVHEFGHAFVAHKLGDRLPASQGRVTLNPLAHADPWGTFLLPLFFLATSGGASYGFGWGRPVEVNPVRFSRRFSMRTGHLMVAAAGPAMNLLFGIFIAILHMTLLATGAIEATSGFSVHTALFLAARLNFILCFFNLIPVPPLDGGTVIKGLLPTRLANDYERYVEPYGIFILAAIVVIAPLRAIFVTPADLLLDGVYQALALLFGLS